MRDAAAIGPQVREVVGAWLVCLGVAAVCFSLLAAAPRGRDPSQALISPDTAARVAADADRADTHRPWRC